MNSSATREDVIRLLGKRPFEDDSVAETLGEDSGVSQVSLYACSIIAAD